MIKIFKTIAPVEVDSRTGKTAEVFAEVGEVIFNGLAFYGKADYYYFKDGQRFPIDSTVATFTIDEAAQLAAMGPLEGATFPEQFASLIVRATLYQFDTAQYYKMGSSGWELYVEPEPEPEPAPEPDPVPEEETEDEDPGV